MASRTQSTLGGYRAHGKEEGKKVSLIFSGSHLVGQNSVRGHIQHIQLIQWFSHGTIQQVKGGQWEITTILA